jgi:hypothetical protein
MLAFDDITVPCADGGPEGPCGGVWRRSGADGLLLPVVLANVYWASVKMGWSAMLRLYIAAREF